MNSKSDTFPCFVVEAIAEGLQSALQDEGINRGVDKLQRKNKKLLKKNRKLQKKNRRLDRVVQRQKQEIAILQKTVENLNVTIGNFLADDETSADDEGNKTSSADDSVDDGTTEEVGAP